MPRYRLRLSTFWQPFDGEHRCSRAFCHRPAVLVGTQTVGGAAWDHVAKHVRHRYLCDTHADDYGLVEYHDRWWHRLSQPWPLPVPRKPAAKPARKD